MAGDYSVCWNLAKDGFLADGQENLHRHFGSQKGGSQGGHLGLIFLVRPAVLDLRTLLSWETSGSLGLPVDPISFPKSGLPHIQAPPELGFYPSSPLKSVPSPSPGWALGPGTQPPHSVVNQTH